VSGFLLLLLVTGLAFSQSMATARRGPIPTPTPTAPGRVPPTPLPTPSPRLPRAAEALARAFMSQFVSGQFAAQWMELTPFAQAQWPSQSARVAMLQTKFSGPAQPVSFTVGTATPAASAWTPPEAPAEHFRSVLLVPVTVTFASPSSLLPAGVAADYQALTLAISAPRVSGPPQVVTGGPALSSLLVLGEGPAAMDAPIVVPPNPVARSAAVPILMYHVVAPFPVRSQWNTGYAYQLEYGLTVTPGQFATQMAALAASQAHAISLQRLSDFLLYGLPLPQLPVVITFDDGREGPFQYAVPILTNYGFTATFFVPVGLVGETVHTLAGFNPQSYLTWAQVTTLSQGGFSIEDHTLYDNKALWGASPATVQALVAQPSVLLAQHTGVPVQFIAYTGVWPYPSPATAGPAELSLFSELRAVGFVAGVIDARINSAQESSQMLWQLPRIRMNPNQPPSALLRWVG